MLRRTVAAAQPTNMTAYMKLFEVYRMQTAVRQSGTVWYGTSGALSASQTLCHASGGSSLA